MRIREAAMVPALVAAFIQFFLPFFTDDTQVVGAVNAALAFLAGLATAFLVSAEKGLALLAGSANSLIQIAFMFGIALTDHQQATLATLLTLIAGAFTRTQVVAPVAAAKVTRVQAPAQVINRQTGA